MTGECEDRCVRPGDEVHLWIALPDQIRASQRLAIYRSWLSERERDRCRRLSCERARRLFVVSHALVRSALSQYVAVDPPDWTFATGAAGKPEIDGPSVAGRLRFNLSQVDGLAACVVTETADCGVDVEDVARVADPMALARRWFAPAEYAVLADLPESQRRQRFFELWTLKEAYVKARGLRLGKALKRVCFEFGGHRGTRVHFAPAWADQSEHWQFALLERSSASRRFVLSVAVRRRCRVDCRLAVRECTPGLL